MDMKLEKLKQELKQKNKELDEYIEKHENYLSDEAEAIRRDIYKIANEINRIERNDTNVGSIEEDKERLMKTLNYELDKIMTRSSKVETATEILNLRQPITYMFLNLLAEREQDKKRIKELEEENKHLKYLYDNCCKCLLDTTEKQKVKDKINQINKAYEDSKNKKWRK